KRAYCLKTQPATGETYPKSDLFNKADMIATLLSDGASVAEVTQDNSDEYGVSQIFIAIEVDKLIDGPTRDAKLQRIMDYVTTAERADENQAIRLPGHEFTTLLAENRRNGITVDDSVWAKIQAL
ncbi:Ldh family oxidoreductase, partial [Escherichia coli]|nr:Ldh family oxidoreductase [Escherichia coli]